MKFKSLRSAFMLVMVTAGMGVLAPKPCFADWTKTIDCPRGRVYRDVRRDAGREEFCELQLPGSLWVEDGPSRWWYGEGSFGEEGTYKAGRKIGRWKECTRFGRCRYRSYDLVYPQEKAHGVKPEIPVSYSHGKYVFDFSSCWSTWVTRQTTESFLELNIGGGLVRCEITYIPSIEKDRPGGNQGRYLCQIPYAVAVRRFDSLDLRKELPKVGLPQFCGQDEAAGPASAPNGSGENGQAGAIQLWVNMRFLDGLTGKESRAWTSLADMVDVECAALERPQVGPELLTVRPNEYAERLVLERMGKDELKAETCEGRFPLSAIEPRRDASGRTLFTYSLSQDRITAKRQRSCLTAQIKLQPTCASR